jgi:hypothetical protein
VRHFHRRKTPAILRKLDVEKAFDTVSWPYLLDALHARGFRSCWCNWISIILSLSSYRVLLNGIEGEPIVHHRGLRQGDPLSSLLFILAMEPLKRILALAMECGLLSPLKGRIARLRSSLYADDATIFLNSLAADVRLVKAILSDSDLRLAILVRHTLSDVAVSTSPRCWLRLACQRPPCLASIWGCHSVRASSGGWTGRL